MGTFEKSELTLCPHAWCKKWLEWGLKSGMVDLTILSVLSKYFRVLSDIGLDRILDFVGPNKILSDQTFYKAYC